MYILYTNRMSVPRNMKFWKQILNLAILQVILFIAFNLTRRAECHLFKCCPVVFTGVFHYLNTYYRLEFFVNINLNIFY